MVIKILRLLHLGFFLGFFYFQIFPFSFFETNFVKKSMQSNCLPKIRIRCIMLYARFLPNFKCHILKLDKK
jgi:hypothetical protein